MTIQEAGRQAANEIGIEWKEPPADGRWHDTPAEGKEPHNSAGRIKIFIDGEGGLVKNWITGKHLAFWKQNATTHSPEERETRSKRVAKVIAEAEAEQQQEAAETAIKATKIWKAAKPADDNPYLGRKGVSTVKALRQIDARLADKIAEYPIGLTGTLLVVPVKIDGHLSSCQLIDGDGNKRFLSGRGTTSAGFWATGKLPDDGPIQIAEGVATALSCYEATGFHTVAALSCGNMPAVAQAIRKKHLKASLIICSDKGNGEDHARQAAIETKGLLVVSDISNGSDFNDLHVADGLDAVRVQIDGAVKVCPTAPEQSPQKSISVDNVPNEANEPKKRQSQADMLLDMAKDLELFHDQNGEGHVFMNGQCYKLKSGDVRKYLSFQMYKSQSKIPNADALSQAISTLEGIALFDRERRCLENRVAAHDNEILYDLGDRRAVLITAGSWEIVEAPAKFRRYNHQTPQVEPISGGDIYRIFDFINVGVDHRLLILVTLISYFVPDIPHPIFHPWGPQGSGKTSLFRVFKRLVDPSNVETLMCGRDRSKIIHALVKHYLPLFDNLSGLDGETSDLLCQACTGGGIEQRQLYTDDDSVIFQIRRCIGINGINLSIVKPDLLDRTLLLHLERIPPKKRQEESVLWANFEAARPHILGGIFDVLSKAISTRQQVKLDELPRLADFGRWGYAIAEAIKPDLGQQFINDYKWNVDQQAEETIQNNTLATAVLTYMENRNEWKTTIGDAYRTLKQAASPERSDKSFPSAERDLRRQLERIRATLEEKGVKYTTGKRSNAGYPIHFRKLNNFGSLGSQGSPTSSATPLDQESSEPSEPNPCNSWVDVEDSIPSFDF